MDYIKDWEFHQFDVVGSTNDVIKEFCLQQGKRVVVSANRQTSGRGRRGRSWVSEEGNLFFSMAFEFDLRRVGELAVVCGLSLLQAVKKLKPSANLVLKWPNDVLLDGAKVCGMLLEKGEKNYLICGIGVNISHRPEVVDALYPVISLANAEIVTTPQELLGLYLEFFSRNLATLEKNKFDELRKEWLQNAGNLGKQIIVRLEKNTLVGIFRGIDENAVLLLETSEGVKKVLAGDVYFVENER